MVLTPAAINLVANVDAPVTVVVADLPTAPPASELATKPIVRVDLMPAGASAKMDADVWSDLQVGDHAAPDNALFVHQLAGATKSSRNDAPDANAEELALMEAEWAAMQQG